MPAWKLRRCEPSPQTARPQNSLPIPSKGRRTNGDTMDAAMAREAQTEAFDNFESSPYTEANAMQDGGEEVGTRGGYGRRLPNGLAFSEEARRAEGGAQEEPPFAGRIGQSTSVLEQAHGRAGAGETAPEKIREINGRRYAYGQPDVAGLHGAGTNGGRLSGVDQNFFSVPLSPDRNGFGGFFLLRKRRGLHRPRQKMPGTLNPARPGCSAAVMAGTYRQKAFSPR